MTTTDVEILLVDDNPDDLEFLASHVSSGIKESKIYGRGDGFSVNYGHNDAFISPAAGREIYPLVAQWLGERDGSGAGPKIKQAGGFPEH